MLNLPRTGTLLALLSGTCLVGTLACSKPPIQSTQPTPQPGVTAAPAAPESADRLTQDPSPSSQPDRSDPYKLALDKADSARNISQSAQSQDDWSLVAGRWQQAIQLLKSVPPNSPYRGLVQPKISEYQRNLAYAKQQGARQARSSQIAFEPEVSLPLPPPASTDSNRPRTAVSRSAPESGKVFRTRIKRRAGGTPVIDVTFNGRQTFEMIVDTGASGTVITEEMAAALGVNIVGKTKVDTASDRDVEVPLAYVNSISVSGATVKGVIVAVGGPALELGLLGHDFFGDYDVTVKRDVVEFRSRS
jgi:predicted aspartyl protease